MTRQIRPRRLAGASTQNTRGRERHCCHIFHFLQLAPYRTQATTKIRNRLLKVIIREIVPKVVRAIPRNLIRTELRMNKMKGNAAHTNWPMKNKKQWNMIKTVTITVLKSIYSYLKARTHRGGASKGAGSTYLNVGQKWKQRYNAHTHQTNMC